MAQFIQLAINDRIQAADEQGSHRGHLLHMPPGVRQFFQPAQIGLRHSPVMRFRKDEGGCGIDALVDHAFYGAHSLGGGGHLDHHIRAVHRGEQ